MFIRRLPKFQYHAPSTIGDALKLLSLYGGKSRVFAGGTDLFVSMKKREMVPEHLINLKMIADLQGNRYSPDSGLSLGALMTITALQRLATVKDIFTGLWDAANSMASPQIRNLGTIGGNLCSGVPSADTAPPLIALGASLTLAGKEGERNISVEKFFKGPGETVLQVDELLKEINLPAPPEESGSAYLKIMRRKALDLALVGVAVYLRVEPGTQICNECRIAMGAVAPTPLRASKAEQSLVGKEINEDSATAAGEIASKEASPITDIRATKEYRTEVIKVLTKRATLMALDRIREKGI